jgi:hypothetical protein
MWGNYKHSKYEKTDNVSDFTLNIMTSWYLARIYTLYYIVFFWTFNALSKVATQHKFPDNTIQLDFDGYSSRTQNNLGAKNLSEETCGQLIYKGSD